MISILNTLTITGNDKEVFWLSFSIAVAFGTVVAVLMILKKTRNFADSLLVVLLISLASIAVLVVFEIWVFVLILFVLLLIGAIILKSTRQAVGWFLLLISAFLFACVGFTFLGPWAYLFLLFLLVSAGLMVSYGLTSSYATTTYVISTIGASMRQNLPLAMALDSAAGNQKDTRAKILRQIKNQLVQGYSLSESIRRGYPKCPSRSVAMIAAAERIDQVPHAIKAIEADMTARSNERKRIKPVSALYPIVLLIIVSLVVLGMAWKVIPKFKEIIEEMVPGESLPWATRLMMDIATFIAYETPLGWILTLSVIFLVVLATYIRFRTRRVHDLQLSSRAGDYIKWHFPISRWFEKNYSLVQIVEYLRLSLNTGSTVDKAISNTLELDLNDCFKRQVREWLTMVEAGEDISESAIKSGMGSSLAWAFDQDVNQGNTPQILETLETFYRTNYSYAVNLARFVAEPFVTILMGLLVGFVIYALFSPVVATIQFLATDVVP
ncbi:MAG: type II secretion system F family protein [Planctomycetota bacterium]|jgi:type IV pilus assembly protein PilC